MSTPPSVESIRDTDHSTSFNPVESGCTITLDNPLLNQQLSSLLEEFRIIFQSALHPDGIDCPLMRIPFHDESTVVKRKPRLFNPEVFDIQKYGVKLIWFMIAISYYISTLLLLLLRVIFVIGVLLDLALDEVLFLGLDGGLLLFFINST
ncbi:hypothetical protein GEMRC1_010109 [Eukaryota sp. GEM-RC1]